MTPEEKLPGAEPPPVPFRHWGPPWGRPRPQAAPGLRRPVVHLALFLATVITTVIAGALQQGVDPFQNPWGLLRGIPFSFTLLLILGTHEMGHYLVSRRHRLLVTLPYFFPAPPIPFFIGTFGAVIRILSPIQDKRALLDVGCSGPLIGVAVAVPVLLVGLKLSTVKVLPGTAEGLVLGKPLLFQFLSWLTFGPLPDDHHIILHPVAFAGWIGLLVTAFNLMPVGQLDGGHVAYALFPDQHRRISLGCLALLVVCGFMFWQGWLIWAMLLYLLGFRHPPPSQDWVPLDERRRLLGFLTILVFALTFTPTPIKVG